MKKLKDILTKVAEPVTYHTAFVGFFRPGQPDPMAAIGTPPPVPGTLAAKPIPDVPSTVADDDDEYKPFFVGFMNRGKKKKK